MQNYLLPPSFTRIVFDNKYDGGYKPRKFIGGKVLLVKPCPASIFGNFK